MWLGYPGLFVIFIGMLERYLGLRSFRWALALLSGCLLVVSFPFTGSLFPLAFIAWVPLLLLEGTYTKDRRSLPLFFQAYLVFFIYNVGTTWWIYNADEAGAYMAFICNSLIMALAFYVFHRIKRKIGANWAAPLFFSTWIAFEFGHFNWEVSWPWLTIGNVFARVPELVQWYSWTGVLGGTLWVLGINTFFLSLVRKIFIEKRSFSSFRSFTLRGVILIFLPALISIIVYSTYSETKQPYEVVVVQPNVDPYNEKFSGSDEAQLMRIMDLADKQVTPLTKLVIAPETALYPMGFYEEDLPQMAGYPLVKERRIQRWHNAAFLIGASTRRFFETKHSAVSRAFDDDPGFYESYNTSVLFGDQPEPVYVHKSKLVLGVEKIPFSGVFPWLEDMSINLGGSTGSLGIEEKGPAVMKAGNVAFAPVVCYESIYGDFVRLQCVQKAGFIAIITNDGWWKDTPGYKQHFAFARLRAIENRKYVARSANTGISGFINQRGDILQQTSWWKEAARKQTIQLNQAVTVYQILGDFVGYLALVGFIFFVLLRVLKIFGIGPRTMEN